MYDDRTIIEPWGRPTRPRPEGDDTRDLTAVVTGAARGIGRSVVMRLRDAGYRIVAVDISPTVADLTENGWVVAMAADLTVDATPAAAIGRAIAEFGRLDLLVNNAGRFLRRPILDTTDDDFDALFAINGGRCSDLPAPPYRS
jgi:NAD(P)-dependent dehydrogenase (short-subunit alcohol dehydrogenase family)